MCYYGFVTIVTIGRMPIVLTMAVVTIENKETKVPASCRSLSSFLAVFFVASIVSRGFAAPSAVECVEALREDEEATAKAAQAMLIRMGAEAIRPLQRALGDPNFLVRRRAAEVLGRLGPLAKRAAPDLVPLLRDPQFDVHAAAEASLIQMGEAAVPALSDALGKSDDRSRRTLIVILGKCGPSAATVLVRVLQKDENPFIRLSAAEALAGMRPAAPRHPSATESLADANVVVASGVGAAPTVARRLATVGAPLVVPALTQALSDLEEGVRGAAADTLAQLGEASKAAIGGLIAVAQADKDALIRQKAVRALEKVGLAVKESLPGLIAGMSHPSEEVRREIIDTIGVSNIPFSEAAPVFESAFKDADPGVRMKTVHACAALAKQGSGALAVLRPAIADAQPDIRSAAIRELGRLKESQTEAASELSRALTDPNPALRQQVIQSLSELGAAGLPGLVQALSDGYSVLGDQAAKAIVKLGPDAVPALQAFQSSPDPAIRQKVIQLLKKIKQKPHRSKK